MRTDFASVNVSVLQASPLGDRMIARLEYYQMRIFDAHLIVEGPPQFQRIVSLRLSDGSEITCETAIAMIRYHGARFRQWSGDRWNEVVVIHSNIWSSGLTA
jgi:hypothetical protein